MSLAAAVATAYGASQRGWAGFLARAEVRAELLFSAIPERGAITPSFTRATTKTWKNNDGHMVTGVAGEIDFPGARRVHNTVGGSSEDITNAGWSNYTVVPAAISAGTSDVPTGAVQSTSITAAGTYSGRRQSTRLTVGAVYLATFSAKGAVGGEEVWFSDDLATGGVKTVTTEWADYAIPFTAAHANMAMGVKTAGATVKFSKLQLLNVTAETDQTSPREYVPVGVPSAWWGPEHISNGDFSNGTTGWTAINSGSLSVSGGKLQVTQAGATNGTAEQAITTIAGVKYVATVMARTSNASYQVYIVAGASSGSFALGAALTSSTTATLLTLEFTATGTTTYIGLRNTAVGGLIGTFDVVSVKPAVYLGSMVDGIQCFPTNINSAPLTTMERFKPQSAATNLAFKSNGFATAPWAMIGTPSLTKNATGVDGATSAWTVTVSQGDEYNQLNGITLTAATYTRSIKIKKTTGAQPAYPIILVNAPATYLAAATIDTTNGIGTIWTAYSGWTIATSSVRVTSWNDDFWLVELTFLGTATGWAVGYIGTMTTNATKSSGSLADADVTGAAGTHVMQHLQIELGSKSTSYIDNPNAAAVATRDADVLTYTGGDIANLKTLACTFQRAVGVSNIGMLAAIDDGTDNNISVMYLNNAADVRFQGNAAASVQWNLPLQTYTAGTQAKASQSWATNDVKGDFNGTACTPDTSANVPTGLASLYIGHQRGNYTLNGNVGGIYGWTHNLSQSELAAVDR